MILLIMKGHIFDILSYYHILIFLGSEPVIVRWLLGNRYSGCMYPAMLPSGSRVKQIYYKHLRVIHAISLIHQISQRLD